MLCIFICRISFCEGEILVQVWMLTCTGEITNMKTFMRFLKNVFWSCCIVIIEIKCCINLVVSRGALASCLLSPGVDVWWGRVGEGACGECGAAPEGEESGLFHIYFH